MKSPLLLDRNKRYEAALYSVDLYYSFPNIIEGENNELKYSSDNGSTWQIVKLNTGCYELETINKEIHRQMVANGHHDNGQFYVNLTANVSTLKSIVEVTSENCKVNLGTLGPTLGFPSDTLLDRGYHESPNIVDIIKINSILVNIDIISGSYVNGSHSPVIYSFFPNVGPGYKIVERPRQELLYFPVNRSEINSIRVWLTDQDHRPVDVRGERVTLMIVIREKLASEFANEFASRKELANFFGYTK